MSNSTIPLIDKLCYSGAIPVVISSTNHQFAIPFSGLLVGVAGGVVLDFGDFGIQVTLNLPVGIHKIFGTKIYTSSTASAMVALF